MSEVKGYRSRYTGGWEPTKGDVKEREAWEREHGFNRGCGQRSENGLYVTVGTSPLGCPIEDFLIDPVISWSGGQLRAPMFVEDSKGTVHIILGVGATYYPFVPDFVEEARNHGVSKRVPRNFNIERLTPDKSKLLLAHPRAIPRFEYETDCTCPKHNEKPHECIGFLWSLSCLKDFGKVHSVGIDEKYPIVALIKTPSCFYHVTVPQKPETFIDNYSSGIFLAFPLSICKFEYVNRQKQIPPKLKERIEKTKFRLECVPR